MEYIYTINQNIILIMKRLIFFYVFVLSISLTNAQIINIPSPNGIDDTSTIHNAIKNAASGSIIQLKSGTYKVKGNNAGGKNASIYVNKKNNIHIRGASVGTNGTPSTKIVRILDAPNTTAEQPAPIYLEQCNNVTLEDISFSNESPHLTAGIVKKKGSNYFEVEIFKGLPLDEGCQFTAGNLWDINGNLKDVGSLSYSASYGTGTIINQSTRRMRINLTNTSTLNLINVWDRISWHYGTPGRAMIYVNGGSNITLDNTDVYNTLRSAIYLAYINNLSVKNVDIKPIGNQLASSPRDGIHSSRIRGHYLVENCTVEGTRLDAFVSLGTFAETFNVVSNRKIQIKTDNSTPSFVAYDTSLPLAFVDQNGEKVVINVNSARKLANDGGKSIYELQTSKDIPNFVVKGTRVIPRGLTTRSLKTKNNNYKNIAGASEILYSYNATSENNRHSYIMYPAIRLGSNASKGISGGKYVIKNSTFTNCVWENHPLAYNLRGYIATGNNHKTTYDNIFVNDITITNNTFTSTTSKTSYAAIELNDAYDINISNNTFNGFEEPVKFDPLTVRDIHINNNMYGANNIITKKINVAKDAFVKGGNFANRNYGGYSFTQTKNSSNPKFTRITFLNYSLPNIPNSVSEAKLFMYSKGSNRVKARQNIKVATNNSWGENTITYNNKPSYGYANGYAGLDANANYTGWIEKNINSSFNFRPLSNSLTLVLEESASTSSLGTFYTKEDSFRGESFLLLKYRASGFQRKAISTDEIVTISKKPDFKLYPNPVPVHENNFKVYLSNHQETLDSYEIYSMNGRRIQKKNISDKVTNFQQQEYLISIGNISKGMYFIKLNTSTTSKIIKFIKQ